MKGLYLLSPAGLGKANLEEDLKEFENKKSKVGLRRRMFFKVAKYVIS